MQDIKMMSKIVMKLLKFKNICLAAIAEMDKKIVTRLTNIVNDVNREIHKVFSSMFGGGTAKVEFIDPKNILESGISIYAQPPGKTVKNLKLFSGMKNHLLQFHYYLLFLEQDLFHYVF
ncbi:hypothetical protein ONA23_03725 [Mycoplasmopsis cynos]|uniref:hypothetical protein n=1 Tax=Mycoplasmopsis cynos TaxID=171284 RepID=UPI0024CCE86A|nr:hypothetical protein [Mycoplasmopsis cynos]WAM06123.1 hypothetical protein ONA23_03725 [Mycoplasmopsis cynos]